MDVQAQRKKELEQAHQEMKNATPEAYPQARIRYFTLKEGQGWLRTEKERLASAHIDPLLKDLDARYEQSNVTPVQETDASESRYLHRRLLEEKDKVGVALRSLEFSNTLSQTPWLPYTLNMLIAVLGVGCVYLLLSGKASRIFRPTNTI